MKNVNKLDHKIYILGFIGLVGLVLVLLVQGAAGFYQADGTPSTPFLIEPVSLLIGAAGGAIAVGVPVMAHAISHRGKGGSKDDDCDGIAGAKHTKTGHVSLLKRSPDVEQIESIKLPKDDGKKEFKGHVSLLK